MTRQEREQADSTKTSAATAAHSDPIARLYIETRTAATARIAMQTARQTLEAVCAELAQADSELVARSTGEPRDLNSQIDKLEKRARQPGARVSKVVVAAMRSVQADGNYASHGDGDPFPPREAFTAAMASLALVVRVCRKDLDSLRLRSPAPALPVSSEARRLHRRARARLPTLGIGRERGDIRVRDSADDQEVLAALNHFVIAELGLCQRLCTIVAERETEREDLAKMPVPELVLFLDALSVARPARVPKRVSLFLEEVHGRAERVRHALNELQARSAAAPTEMVGSAPEEHLTLVAEVADPSQARALVTWFERDYLGLPLARRRPMLVIGGVLLLGLAWWAGAGFSKQGVRSERDAELRARLCEGAGASQNAEACAVLGVAGR